jgi:predicted molibdopterin-dependent oxidoreductase YjgC
MSSKAEEPGAAVRRVRAECQSPAIQFRFDGGQIMACEGQTIAAALIASGRRILRRTSRRAEPRGLFCGMGVCFDCLVQVDGCPNVRACQTPVAHGIVVESQQGAGSGCREVGS